MLFNFSKRVLFFTLYILTEELNATVPKLGWNVWSNVYVKSTLNT